MTMRLIISATVRYLVHLKASGVSYRDGLSWNRVRGCCHRSLRGFAAVWGGSAGGCWEDWFCEAEPQNQTQRHPSWSAYTGNNKRAINVVMNMYFCVITQSKDCFSFFNLKKYLKMVLLLYVTVPIFSVPANKENNWMNSIISLIIQMLFKIGHRLIMKN